MEINEKYTVLVTGFGPFDNHVINASWQAVKELYTLCTKSKEMKDIKMIVKEIPVSYEDVAMCIPKLWEEYKPTLVLHVGVSHKAKCLTIEYCAHSNGYTKVDVCNKCPNEDNIDPKILQTKINVRKVCSTINENSNKTKCNACISNDAGRYLCEYIFYKSLLIAPEKTLFVHVPDFNQYSSVQTAKGLYDILLCIIKDMKGNEQQVFQIV